jgi:hypothetical protein
MRWGYRNINFIYFPALRKSDYEQDKKESRVKDKSSPGKSKKNKKPKS